MAERNTRAIWRVPLAWNLRCEWLNTAMAVWLYERSDPWALPSIRGPVLRSRGLCKSSQESGPGCRPYVLSFTLSPEQGRDKMSGEKCGRVKSIRITLLIFLQQFLVCKWRHHDIPLSVDMLIIEKQQQSVFFLNLFCKDRAGRKKLGICTCEQTMAWSYD